MPIDLAALTPTQGSPCRRTFYYFGERSEFTDFKELLEAIFFLVKNPATHTTKVNWKTDVTKTIDILTVVSFVHKYLDRDHRILGKL